MRPLFCACFQHTSHSTRIKCTVTKNIFEDRRSFFDNRGSILLQLYTQLVRKRGSDKETPSLAGRSLFKNSPPDCF